MTRKTASLVALVVLGLPMIATAQQSAFDQWLSELRREASELGVQSRTLELAFSEITPPVRRIIETDRSQPERVQTYADYLAARVTDWRIANGRERMLQFAALLDDIAREYGVQARFIVAIWGMETNFGTFPIRESLFNVLATLAYDNRRGSFFRAQFLAAVVLLDQEFPGYEQMKSSWAGAMGQPQFIPESYQRYAVDHDGDGRRDIWDTEADVLASIANYLRARGWSDDHTWGRRVQLPVNDEDSLLNAAQGDLPAPSQCRRYDGRLPVWRDLQDWQALGVRREDGSDLPTRSIPAALVPADAGDGEAYLVYPNFCGIMGYNPALKYALAIGLLSDAIWLR